jgi:hypothetical protein
MTPVGKQVVLWLNHTWNTTFQAQRSEESATKLLEHSCGAENGVTIGINDCVLPFEVIGGYVDAMIRKITCPIGEFQMSR